jgi:hypothetical protein
VGKDKVKNIIDSGDFLPLDTSCKNRELGDDNKMGTTKNKEHGK